ncbi:MAG: NAD-dependent epimerase/dehydratase family protein [Candidatus Thorarchaeota archaeon]
MRVLVTGAFGNVGESTLLSLFETDYEICCFDIETAANLKKQKHLSKIGVFDTFWGDIRDSKIIRRAVKDIECIIHLAAILPPASDRDPEFTRSVNISGTENLIDAASKSSYKPKFLYASSIATYGHCPGRGPPKTSSDPQVVTDVYTETKIKAEQYVCASSLPWTIFRFGVVPPLNMNWLNSALDPFVFDIPLTQRIEFVHTRDIGLAVANAVDAPTEGRILLLGGGEYCRMTYRDFMAGTLTAMGMGMLPDSAFREPTCDEDYFHTDWMDTSESQSLLRFQTRSFDDYRSELSSATKICNKTATSIDTATYALEVSILWSRLLGNYILIDYQFNSFCSGRKHNRNDLELLPNSAFQDDHHHSHRHKQYYCASK